jgi:hypothetical protein
MIGLEWEGFRLGDLEAGDVTADDDHPVLEVLGRVGIAGLGTAPRNTVLTPSPNGGDVPGPSLSRAGVIRIEEMRTTERDWLLRFRGAMTELAPDDERPLTLHGLLFGDDDGAGGTLPAQVWARPESCDPDLSALGLGVGEWRLRGTSWTVADPTIYSAEPTVLESATSATSQALTFTNQGTRSTLNGRAWTASITAVGSTVRSPWIELDGHRVTWVGLNLTVGQTLTIGADRHTYIGALPVDGYRWSGDSPDPDWPITVPGDNEFTFGRASGGSLDVELSARSTW